jgi:hypothetical protein
MYRMICRRLVALAVAYSLALAPILPLLAAFAWAADLGAAGIGEVCASKRSDARSPAHVPNGHGAACPLGAGCPLQDCSAVGLPAPGGATTAIGVLPSARFFVHPAATVLRPRDGGPALCACSAAGLRLNLSPFLEWTPRRPRATGRHGAIQ